MSHHMLMRWPASWGFWPACPLFLQMEKEASSFPTPSSCPACRKRKFSSCRRRHLFPLWVLSAQPPLFFKNIWNNRPFIWNGVSFIIVSMFYCSITIGLVGRFSSPVIRVACQSCHHRSFE